MDIHNLKSCITHDEATIRSFMQDPEYADYYMNTVIADGDAEEIECVRNWYNEAKERTHLLGYWENIVGHALQTAKEGKNLDVIIALLNRALGILKAATPSEA